MLIQYIKRKVREEMIRELLKDVPNKVKNPALRVLSDNKYKVEKLLMHIAYELHRKMLYDRKNSQLYEGQLIMTKLFFSMIETAYTEEKPKDVVRKIDPLLEKGKAGIRAVINKIKS